MGEEEEKKSKILPLTREVRGFFFPSSAFSNEKIGVFSSNGLNTNLPILQTPTI